jgi:pimeloyl-ACP methyl ester carboxylesterase
MPDSPSVDEGVDEFAGLYKDSVVRANGLRLHCTEWGEKRGDRPWYLFTGGVIQHAHVWDPVAAELASDRFVVCLDLRGQGTSEWAEDGYSLDSFVADVHSFIQEVGGGPVVFVGHSLGARIGIALGSVHPGDVASIILSDAGPDVPREVALAVRSEVDEYFAHRGFHDHAEAVAYFAKAHPEWKPVFHKIYSYYGLKWNWAGRLIPRADPSLRWITSAATKQDMGRLWDLSKGVSAAVLLVRGMRPNSLAFVTDETVARMTAVMGRLEVNEFATGHYVPLEDPLGFSLAVRSFVESVC